MALQFDNAKIRADRLTLGQIARYWANEPDTYPHPERLEGFPSSVDHADAECAILSELSAAVLRGDFEPGGETMLQIPTGGAVQINGRDVPMSGGKIGQAPMLPFRRRDMVEGIRNTVRAAGIRKGRTRNINLGQLPAGEDGLADVPFSAYSDVLQVGVRSIVIGRDDFADWCKSKGWELPRFWFGDTRERDKPSQGDEQRPNRKVGGRLPEYDREAAFIEAIRVANTPDGLPETQAGMQRHLAQWFLDTYGKEPSDTWLKNFVRKIYQGVKPSEQD